MIKISIHFSNYNTKTDPLTQYKLTSINKRLFTYTSRFDPSGVVYQGVCTGGGFNPTPNAHASSGSGWDIAVFKIDFEVPLSALQISVEDFTVCDLPPYDVPFSCSAAPNGVYQWDFGEGPQPYKTLYTSIRA
ncbi:hypothetical protein N9F08_01095 [bacterium]|nr:hypothetical protein [bacterium]